MPKVKDLNPGDFTGYMRKTIEQFQDDGWWKESEYLGEPGDLEDLLKAKAYNELDWVNEIAEELEAD